MYKWQPYYEAVIPELETEKLKFRLEAAENAIFLRVQEIAGNSDHHEERNAMNDALAAIRVVQVEKLHFPKFPHEVRRLVAFN